ncbi:purine-nucleoside phosphorylase [Salinimicrobium sediminilitoris]|uniref:purine-nucleoside phosphorylase n=1 Tax=Salinimicrobium sediminilitoris TaxID=2876715 RepID=UPI001E327D8C|nr:purine-nucleoside phosphorylase [Salinimicrobium sediminilitoris]MCC8361155.1 purine-nucleoside phosphorylase [Salinimicrobium sediminilitoris]
MLKDLEHTTEFLEARGFDKPEIGIILGTGLGKLIDELEIIAEVSYNHIPGFPTATVEFHKGKLIFGKLEGKKVVVMQGRFHIYEGYSLWDVTFPVRVMKRLGIKKLLISNAAGSLNPEFKKGEIMLIDDHINLQGGSPLAFRGVEQLGTRFTDMSAPYDQQSGRILQEIAKENGFPLHKGVYVSVVGPQLETRAEYRYLRTIGGDAVGMSTVPEVIVANHLKIPIAAVSVLTDEGNPDDLKPVNIQDIIETAGKAEPQMITLFRELIKRIELKPAE